MVELTQLTPEQFKEKYGVTPDEAAYLHGRARTTGAPRPMGSDILAAASEPVPAGPAGFSAPITKPLDAGRERAPATDPGNTYLDITNAPLEAAFSAGEAVRNWWDPARQPTPPITQDLRRAERNAIAGVAGLPATVPSMYGLGAAGVDYLKTGGSKTAADYMLADGGAENIMKTKENVAAGYRELNPDATPDDVQNMLTDYMKSDDYQKVITANMRPGLSMGSMIQQYANKLAGMDRMPDEQTALDDVQQVVASSLVGLPRAATAAIAETVLKGAMAKVGKSLPARIAMGTVEAATGGTFPLTAGNVALNAGVGEAINTGMRYATDQPTLFSDVRTADPEDVPVSIEQEIGKIAQGQQPEDTGDDVQAHSEAVSIGGIGVLLAGILGFSSRTAGRVVSKAFVDAGKPMAEQVKALTNLEPNTGPLTKVRSVTNSRAPVLDAVRAASGRDAMQQVEAEIGMRTGTSGEVAVNAALTQGRLPGMTNRMVPPQDLNAVFRSFSPDDQQLFMQYPYAKIAKQDRLNQVADYQTELAQEQLKYTAAIQHGSNGNAINAIQAKIADINDKLQRIHGDVDKAVRPSFEDWDGTKINELIQAGDANPNVKKLADALFGNERMLPKYSEVRGMEDTQSTLDQLARHPNHLKLKEDPYDKKTGLPRAMAIWGDRLKEFATPTELRHETSTRGLTSSRDLEADKAVKVNNPINPIDAHILNVRQVVRMAEINGVRRSVADTLMAAGDPTIIRRETSGVQFQFTDKQLATAAKTGNTKLQKLIDNHDGLYTAIRRNGLTEFYSFGDPSIAHVLEFAPHAASAIARALKNGWQVGTTGWAAPAFATTAMIWDGFSAVIAKRGNRSAGMVDTMLRRLTAEEHYTGKVLGHTIDPSFYLQVLAAIPRQLLWQSYGELGRAVETSMLKNSSVMQFIAQNTVGRQALSKAAKNMVRAYDQSSVGIFTHNIEPAKYLNSAANLRTQYNTVLPNYIRHPPIVSQAIKGYMAMLGSVHLAAKYAFFAQNLGRLEQAGGRVTPKTIADMGKRVGDVLTGKLNTNVSEKDLIRLLNDTRQMSGDMSLHGMDKGVGKGYNYASSIFPYLNASVQGQRYLFQELASTTTAFPRLLQGAVLPVLWTNHLMSNWDEKSQEYYYNQMPTWQRATTIIIPTVDTIVKWAHGETVPFSTAAINQVSLSPDFVPITQAFMAGVEALGIGQSTGLVLGNKVPITFGGELKAGLGTMFSLMAPPVVQAAAAMGGQRFDLQKMLTGGGMTNDLHDPTFSGASGDQLTVNSDIPRVLSDVIGALFGGAAQIGVNMVDAHKVEQEKGASFLEAAKVAFEEGGKQIRDKGFGRDVPLTPIWGAANRLYKGTPVADRVWQFDKDIKPLLAQLSVEHDRSHRQAQIDAIGAQRIPTITDPMLKAMVSFTGTMFSKGKYKALTKQQTDENSLLTAIDGSRAVMNYDERSTERLKQLRKYQLSVEGKNAVINQWETVMQRQYGKMFEQKYGAPFSLKAFSAAVDASLKSGPAR